MRSLLAIAFLALGPVAAAADLTPTLLKYIVGQVPPQEESEIISGTRSRVWDNPSGLQVERLLFAYAYGMSSEHWSVMLFNPKAPRTDYLGTRDVSFVGRTTGSAATDVYRVNAGRFKGFIVQDFKDAKGRMLILHTPKVALESYKLARFVRP